ncbi:HDOD domain-containing protein [Caldichromatium japonicum]|uniref:HDOD domain-containing protein n=1 Tax=Caldichromatium japonicum TaxID=2699430 RepID=A0A6G7VGL9_9GAMM|nr:HDOD domain-containing protein [Caldichromatium japonicum]QIK38937.1 HDOD domain-containing protein [Caldichromatium japonicum]
MGSPWFDNLIAQARLEDLPIHPETRRLLALVLDDERAPLRQLAWVVMGDPALAIRVLQCANTLERHYPGREIATLEDAIHLIGTRRLAQLVQASPVDAACLNDRRLLYYRHGCARAWLAALLAQDWAALDRDRVPAEIALAALLNNLGELYWLVYGDARINRYLEMLAQPGALPHEAEYLTLGENLEWLGYRLAVRWGLPEMVRESMRARNARYLRPLYVMLATQIARHALGGWRYPGQIADLRLIAELLGLDLSALSARIAAVLAGFNPHAARYGLAPLEPLPAMHSGRSGVGYEPPCPAPFCLAPRADEFARAQELLASDQIQDRTSLILTWLAGLHRGLGLNRVVYATLDAATRTLSAEQLMGTDFEPAFNRFSLKLDEAGAFVRLLGRPGTHWLRTQGPDAVAEVLPPAVKILTGGVSCLVHVVWLGGQAIGLVYADRRAPTCALDARTYRGFSMLADLAGPVLARLMPRSRGDGA